VLVEDRAGHAGLRAEKGLSLLVEDGRCKVLFDTGRSDAFLHNAAAMGISLRDLSHVVLSHGHHDHAGGLGFLMRHLAGLGPGARPVLLAHPDSFLERGLYLRFLGRARRLRNLGAPAGAAAAPGFFRTELRAEPRWLDERLVYLGEIPRPPDAGSTVFGSIRRHGRLARDEIRDDTALVHVGERGLVVMTGCSHSGLVPILDHARTVTGEARVLAVVGGLHLRSASRRTVDRVAGHLRDIGVSHVHGCHCTGRAGARLPNQSCIATGTVMEFR